MAESQDDDMYLFSGSLDQTPGAFTGQDFDNFLAGSPDNSDDTMVAGFMNPNDLAIKRERTDGGPALAKFPRSSRSSASSSSSSTSAQYLKRDVSAATSTTSPGQARNNQPWGSGINGLSMPANEQFFEDTSMSGLDQDFEASNQQMAANFDFDTAASTPSGFDMMSLSTMKPNPTIQPYRRVATISNFSNVRAATPRANPTQFFLGSREASPLSAMLPSTATASPWSKNSPSSGLEETFNGITMNGDSPGNGTLSPTMQFNTGGFSFDPDFGATPQSFHKELASPHSTIHSMDGSPRLTIYPTSLKSRVETQIPIKMVLYPLPQGAKKLRLPTHTVSKPKFLAKPEVDRSPEILELFTSLVCSSAMQDPARLERALARARGDDLSPYTRPSPASSNGSHNSSRDDEDKPLNGGEVKICTGCIQRERKRASRKKQKKPEEEEMFQKDEEKRVVVFNTSEIKDWAEVTKDNQPMSENMSVPPPGAMQVELPMRIACYCRHQNEKMGFQVIFTIKDFRDKVVAQAMTNSIMITDDHKTHNAPPTVSGPHMSQMSGGPQLPGAGVFSTAGMDMSAPQMGGKLFKQSFSTTDLHGLQHNFNPNFPMTPATNPFAIPGSMSAMSSGTMTPRILSRPASPSGPSGPNSKRRKQSGSGKLPTGLTMTRLDTTPNPLGGSATVPNTAASSPYASMASFLPSGDRSFHASGRPQPFSTSPPTPNGNDGLFPANISRSFSLENIPRQSMISAPPSRQPSRPGSPHGNSNRNSFGATDAGFGQAVNSSLVAQASRRPPPIIHKLVPAEGSVTGGTEVTLLGNGFYQGLEVMFGDTEATTTTFWGEKCLNCIAPPALQPGVVAVVFKHEHPQYSAMQQQSQMRPSIFTYTDDREIEIMRLALRTISKQMQLPTDDPYSAAQQLIQQNQQQGLWPQQGGYGMGGGHQRQMSSLSQMESPHLESTVIDMIRLATGSPSENQVRFDLRNATGLTSLHLASSMGMNRLVFALLSAGADPNLVDRSGNTPLHHAAMNGHERVIDRLRLAGADHRIRSLQNFVPADLATTSTAYQATLRPYQHYRVRSAGVGYSNQRQRGVGVSSSKSLYEGSINLPEDGHDIPSEGSGADKSLRLPFAQPSPMTTTSSRAISRRGSDQLTVSGLHVNNLHSNEQSGSTNALMQVWQQLLNMTHLQQQQLAEQIQHFQDAANQAIPHQNPLVRRMSMLFQQRPNPDIADEKAVQDTMSQSALPTYEELYPDHNDRDTNMDLKKSSAVQAAADTAADIYYEKMESVTRDNEKRTPSQASETSRRFVERVELMRDRNLFFVWVSCSYWCSTAHTLTLYEIPLLAIIMALTWSNSSITRAVPVVLDRIGGNFNREVVEVL